MSQFEGSPRPPRAPIAILVSRWNNKITDQLLAGARHGLVSKGVADCAITVVYVPGVWELPLAANRLSQSGQYAAIIALGCVVRGATRHYTHVADLSAEGLMSIQLQTGIPVLNGVLAVNQIEAAQARAGGHYGNKG